jgi:hypothetical protein
MSERRRISAIINARVSGVSICESRWGGGLGRACCGLEPSGGGLLLSGKNSQA